MKSHKFWFFFYIHEVKHIIRKENTNDYINVLASVAANSNASCGQMSIEEQVGGSKTEVDTRLKKHKY